MASLLDEVHLPERAVLGLGIALVTCGLLTPIAGVVYHVVMWEPATEVKRIGPLRPEMVILPTGSFLMGSPSDEPGRGDDETLHEVIITERFAISRTEITQGQYLAVMEERPTEERRDTVLERPCSDAGVDTDLPVVCVDWFEAIRFCNKLSEMEGLEPVYEVAGSDVTWDVAAKGYRLPTEAEWEYAARAATRDRYAGTDDPSGLCHYGNIRDAPPSEDNPDGDEDQLLPCLDSFDKLAPVGSMRPNRWYIFDMSGNVLEWVWDLYGPYPGDGVVDPRGAEDSSYRVYRGGSWRAAPRFARVADRVWGVPSSRFDGQGFRVARSLRSTP